MSYAMFQLNMEVRATAVEVGATTYTVGIWSCSAVNYFTNWLFTVLFCHERFRDECLAVMDVNESLFCLLPHHEDLHSD